ncbi:MAG: peptidoglycan-binding protein [Spirochaetes bacterium]|nr:peptidoglycan-binding protein [Spirochaetota bacterium]
MKKVIFLSILVLAILAFLVFSRTRTQDVVQAPVTEEQSAVPDKTAAEEKTPAPAETPEEKPPLAGEHTVKRGECLWWIAEYEDIYNDPFMWPLIHDSNKDRIDNPDLIYPEQILRIPRSGHTMDEIKEARRRAGAPPPYTPPEGSLPPLD